MPSLRLAQRLFKRLTLLLVGVHALVITFAIGHLGGSQVSAVLIPTQQKTIPWRVVEAKEIEKGTTVPPDTHVMLHIPNVTDGIGREVLLGQQGKKVRYWGYCLPLNYDPALVSTRVGLPGKIFLSEAERMAREIAADQKSSTPSFGSIVRSKRRDSYLEEEKPTLTIRHQIELFEANMLCYLMTEKPLSVGLDLDGDGMNTAMERVEGTALDNADTDGDGLSDKMEFLAGTNPKLRDSDGDGLIDGIEDKNWNARRDVGESDPRDLDTDRDGICDGSCRIRIGRQEYLLGEDQNLNGKRDKLETDPTNIMSCKKGYHDYVVFVECLEKGNKTCPDSCDM